MPLISRMAAIALTLAVLVGLYAGVAGPLITEFREIDDEIASTRELLDRYRQIAAARDAYQGRLDKLIEREAGIGTYLAGGTDALAGAELQELINKTVEEGGGNLRSIQILPVKTDGEFQRIGVRVQLMATVVQLARVLYSLEAGPTFLFIDNLDVSNRRARRRRNEPVDTDPMLLVRLDLSGYLPPESS